MFDAVVESFGIEKIGIDQTGKQHAGQKGLLKNYTLLAWVHGRKFQLRFIRQADFFLPLIHQHRQILPLEPLFQRAALTEVAAVGQTSVVAGNAIGQQAPYHRAITLNRQHRATGGMIDANQVAIDTTLELISVLADVVQ